MPAKKKPISHLKAPPPETVKRGNTVFLKIDKTRTFYGGKYVNIGELSTFKGQSFVKLKGPFGEPKPKVTPVMRVPPKERPFKQSIPQEEVKCPKCGHTFPIG